MMIYSQRALAQYEVGVVKEGFQVQRSSELKGWVLWKISENLKEEAICRTFNMTSLKHRAKAAVFNRTKYGSRITKDIHR